MSDLVERLNEIGAHYSASDRQQTIYEAAREITTLRTELADQARLNGMGSEREARLMARVAELTALLDQHLGTPCEQIRHAQAEATLVDALKPFATYMAPAGMDRDDKGAPLPDEQGVGWVYLTMGDFRRAAAAISALTIPAKEGEA